MFLDSAMQLCVGFTINSSRYIVNVIVTSETISCDEQSLIVVDRMSDRQLLEYVYDRVGRVEFVYNL